MRIKYSSKVFSLNIFFVLDLPNSGMFKGYFREIIISSIVFTISVLSKLMGCFTDSHYRLLQSAPHSLYINGQSSPEKFYQTCQTVEFRKVINLLVFFCFLQTNLWAASKILETKFDSLHFILYTSTEMVFIFLVQICRTLECLKKISEKSLFRQFLQSQFSLHSRQASGLF